MGTMQIASAGGGAAVDTTAANRTTVRAVHASPASTTPGETSLYLPKMRRKMDLLGTGFFRSVALTDWFGRLVTAKRLDAFR